MLFRFLVKVCLSATHFTMISPEARFPRLEGNPNLNQIVHILDHDPQILSRKAGIDLEGDDSLELIQLESPDEYANYLLTVIRNSEDPRVNEDDYLGQVTYDGDSDAKCQRLINLYLTIKPLLSY